MSNVGAGHVGAWRIKSRRGPERHAFAASQPSPAAGCDFQRRVAALREADGRDPAGIDGQKAREIGQRAIGVGQGLMKVDGAGFLEAARRKVVDEQGDITPSRNPLADRASLFRQAEAGVQKDNGRERPSAFGPGQVALDRLALARAHELDALVGGGGSAADEASQQRRHGEPWTSKAAPGAPLSPGRAGKKPHRRVPAQPPIHVAGPCTVLRARR